MFMPTLRPMQIEDMPALMALGRKMHAEADFEPLSFSETKVSLAIECCIGLEGYFGIVAEIDEKIIGLYMASTVSPWYSDDVITKDLALYIVPEHRGFKLAIELIGAYEKWAEGKEVKVVMAADNTGVNVPGVKKLYEGAGFDTVGHVFRKRI